MTKQIDAFLRRHMESFVDANGVKHDGPSLHGMKQAKMLGKEIAEYGGLGDVVFYTSPRYRTQIAAQIMAQTAGLDPNYTIVPELDTMRRSKAYKSAMELAAAGQGEEGIVAYCMNPDNRVLDDQETETPRAYGERLMSHINGLVRHFDHLDDADRRGLRIENLTHEPGLTAVVMNILNMDRYDTGVFGGAAKTAEPVHFVLEQSGKGLVKVRMRYRDMRSPTYTLR